MNEFLIELQAKLDEAKSKGNINADIDQIQSQIDKLKIQAEIDPKTISNLVKQLETVLNQKIDISNININTAQTAKTAQQAGQQIGNNIAQGISKANGQISSALKSFSDLRNFSELNKSISNFYVDASELKNYQTILANVKDTYAEFGQVKITNETFNNGVLEKFKVNIEQVNGDLKETKSFFMSLNEDGDAFEFNGLISGSESVVQHLDKTKNAVNQTAEAINALKDKTKADKIQLSFDDGTYEAKYDSLIAKTQQWVNANDESVISTQKLTAAYNEFNTAASNYSKNGTVENRNALIQKEEELANQIKATTNEVKSQNAEFAKSSKIDSLHQQIQEFYDKNTAAHSKWGAELQDMLNETAHGAQLTATRVSEIEQSFKGVKNEARQAGKLGLSFFDSVKEQAKKFAQWVSITDVVMEGVQAVRKMVDAVYDVDTAMTELAKVSDTTSQRLTQSLEKSTETAKKYGATISDVVSATADWSRLGYDMDASETLAEVATIYKNVGDGIDIDTANESLVSTLQGFQLEADEALSVIDKFNEVNVLAS